MSTTVELKEIELSETQIKNITKFNKICKKLNPLLEEKYKEAGIEDLSGDEKYRLFNIVVSDKTVGLRIGDEGLHGNQHQVQESSLKKHIISMYNIYLTETYNDDIVNQLKL